MSESAGSGINLGSLYYKIEGDWEPLRRTVESIPNQLKPVRVRIEADPGSLQTLQKQIQSAVSGAFRAGGGGGGGSGGGVVTGGGAGGFAAMPIMPLVARPPMLAGGGMGGGGVPPVFVGGGMALPPGGGGGIPVPVRPVLPPTPVPVPAPAPRRGGGGFLGPPSAMGLYFSALFGGAELMNAKKSMDMASLSAGLAPDMGTAMEAYPNARRRGRRRVAPGCRSWSARAGRPSRWSSPPARSPTRPQALRRGRRPRRTRG